MIVDYYFIQSLVIESLLADWIIGIILPEAH